MNTSYKSTKSLDLVRRTSRTTALAGLLLVSPLPPFILSLFFPVNLNSQILHDECDPTIYDLSMKHHYTKI